MKKENINEKEKNVFASGYWRILCVLGALKYQRPANVLECAYDIRQILISFPKKYCLFRLYNWHCYFSAHTAYCATWLHMSLNSLSYSIVSHFYFLFNSQTAIHFWSFNIIRRLSNSCDLGPCAH